MFFCFCFFFKSFLKSCVNYLTIVDFLTVFFLVKRYDCPPLIEQPKYGLPLEKIYISTLYSSPVIVTSIFHIDEGLWSALRLWITPKTLLKIPSLPQLPAEFRLNSIQVEFSLNSDWIYLGCGICAFNVCCWCFSLRYFRRLQFEETKIDSSLLNIEILLISSLTKFSGWILLFLYTGFQEGFYFEDTVIWFYHKKKKI